MIYPVVVYDVMKSVVDSMVVTGIDKVYYQAGRGSEIIKELNDLDNSISYKNNKYPLVAMVLPIMETHNTGYYCEANISRIVIAALNNGTDNTATRYMDAKTFKTILYPCYYEFLRQLARNPNIIGVDSDTFSYTKMDNPGVQKLGDGLSDYVDIIEILNLKIILKQSKTC